MYGIRINAEYEEDGVTTEIALTKDIGQILEEVASVTHETKESLKNERTLKIIIAAYKQGIEDEKKLLKMAKTGLDNFLKDIERKESEGNEQ